MPAQPHSFTSSTRSTVASAYADAAALLADGRRLVASLLPAAEVQGSDAALPRVADSTRDAQLRRAARWLRTVETRAGSMPRASLLPLLVPYDLLSRLTTGSAPAAQLRRWRDSIFDAYLTGDPTLSATAILTMTTAALAAATATATTYMDVSATPDTDAGVSAKLAVGYNSTSPLSPRQLLWHYSTLDSWRRQLGTLSAFPHLTPAENARRLHLLRLNPA